MVRRLRVLGERLGETRRSLAAEVLAGNSYAEMRARDRKTALEGAAAGLAFRVAEIVYDAVQRADAAERRAEQASYLALRSVLM